MKRAALAMLAPLAGCNWVFGLEPTHAAPDAPDAPPPGVPVHVALLVETVATNGSPDAPVEAAIPDLARLEAGTLDGKPTVMLTASADGTVAIPFEIAGPSWRLIYQRQGGAVREYQNLPAEAHVIEPLLGPVTRTPPPAGSGYMITPANYPGGSSHGINRVYTLGAWTEGANPVPGAGATLDYDLATAGSLSGGLATPKPGDRGVLLDYSIDNNCLHSIGSTDFDAGAPGPPKPPVAGPWLTQPSSPTVSTPLTLGNDIAPFGEQNQAARDHYGFLATTDLPLFTRPPDAARSLLLPNPPMLILRACPVQAMTPPMLQEPIWLHDHFHPAVHTELTASRVVSGVTLVNGISIVTLGQGTTFNVSSNVAFPTGAILDGVALFTSDSTTVARGPGPMTLTWSKKTPSTRADFWEVAVIKLAGNAAVRERVYVTTKESVTIQPADLSTGEHVLEFTAYAGRTPATNGDFRGVSGDQSISVIHSRKFDVQ